MCVCLCLWVCVCVTKQYMIYGHIKKSGQHKKLGIYQAKIIALL